MGKRGKTPRQDKAYLSHAFRNAIYEAAKAKPLYAIATEAGFGHATLSRALNGHDTIISDDFRYKRVAEIIGFDGPLVEGPSNEEQSINSAGEGQGCQALPNNRS